MVQHCINHHTVYLPVIYQFILDIYHDAAGVVVCAGTASSVAVLNTSKTRLAVADTRLINVSLPGATPVMEKRNLIAAAGGSVHYYLLLEDALKVSLCTVLIAAPT